MKVNEKRIVYTCLMSSGSNCPSTTISIGSSSRKWARIAETCNQHTQRRRSTEI